MHIPSDNALHEIYGPDATHAKERFQALADTFVSLYGDEQEVRYFSAPGRTEILGNHTDHNGGKILAASIDMDTICAASLSDDDMVHLVSEGHEMQVHLKLSELSSAPKEEGVISLVAGMLQGTVEKGFQIGGLNCYVSSTVIPSAGVSSSASFEMMFLSCINHFFNAGAIDILACARIGQYAENVYWNKASGLMDQVACAAGGTILLDFSADVPFSPVEFSYDSIGCDLVIVNTGTGHADLSAEYSSIPEEMKSVASALGAAQLSEVKKEDFYAQLPALRTTLHNDRALLRAMHFFEECDRVEEAASAIKNGTPEFLLQAIEASGNSSAMLLQNNYVNAMPNEQPIPYCLALTKRFLKEHDCGVARIHGGGFAGVIMAAVRKEFTEDYVSYMTPHVGKDAIHVTAIRAAGAVEVAV